jgi:hypothetical protein
MQLEDYFDFLSPTDIRIKGHRVGMDIILSYYLETIIPWRDRPSNPTIPGVLQSHPQHLSMIVGKSIGDRHNDRCVCGLGRLQTSDGASKWKSHDLIDPFFSR